jgi:hypothetical protein
MKPCLKVLPAFLLIFSVELGFAQDATLLSEAFFSAVKSDDQPAADVAVNGLAALPEAKLELDLADEHRAKAFWLNIYNTSAQYLLKKSPGLFKDRDNFFQEPRIVIAGTKLSLEDIEHGILRHSKNKYTLGYFGKILTSDFEERFRLSKVDYRIHFALNCGAKSCPSIMLYKHDILDQQLNAATARYLKRFSRYDQKKDEVYVPALCYWFKADFGGEEGVLRIHKEFGIVPANKDPEVEYLDYDWTLSLSNYTD